jgi:hypothetical protein
MASKMEFLVTARRQDGSVSLATCKDATLALDTALAGRPPRARRAPEPRAVSISRWGASWSCGCLCCDATRSHVRRSAVLSGPSNQVVIGRMTDRPAEGAKQNVSLRREAQTACHARLSHRAYRTRVDFVGAAARVYPPALRQQSHVMPLIS